MQPDSYQFLSQLLKTRSGLALTEEKTYLLESRLLPIAKHHELETIEELVHKLRFPGNNDIVEEVVDAMTTNESMFFRDIKPFEQFRKDILPQLLAANSGMRKLRIWSAACSTGQEPYSIAMCLQEEAAVLNGWNIEILATDLSPTVLEKSKSGIYTQFEVQRGLPIQMLLKYFAKEGETNWKINEKTRSMVRWVSLMWCFAVMY
jgi:chemotaxis protein methyltransferase CheR